MSYYQPKNLRDHSHNIQHTHSSVLNPQKRTPLKDFWENWSHPTSCMGKDNIQVITRNLNCYIWWQQYHIIIQLLKSYKNITIITLFFTVVKGISDIFNFHTCLIFLTLAVFSRLAIICLDSNNNFCSLLEGEASTWKEHLIILYTHVHRILNLHSKLIITHLICFTWYMEERRTGMVYSFLLFCWFQ